MRKLFFQMMVSLDGFLEGPNRELDWHNVDEEFNQYAISMLNSVDLLLFGRVTYELMAGYWPTPYAMKHDAVVAERMNSLPKIVFSRTLGKAEWQNTTVVRDNAAGVIEALKNGPGKDMAILGSSDLALSLMDTNAIDEYRIFLNPTALGRGKPLFSGLDRRRTFTLTKSAVFTSGNVLLTYALNRPHGTS